MEADLVLCHRCGKKLALTDPELKSAAASGKKLICARCRSEKSTASRPKVALEVPAGPASPPASGGAPWSSIQEAPLEGAFFVSIEESASFPAPPRRMPARLTRVASGLLGLLVVVALVALVRPRRSTPPGTTSPAPEPKTSAAGPPGPPASVSSQLPPAAPPAGAPSASPELEGLIDRLDRLSRGGREAGIAQPARRGGTELLPAERRTRLEGELDVLDQSLRAAEEKEEYGRALGLLASAEKHHSDIFWIESLALRARVLRERIESRFAALIEEGLAAEDNSEGALRRASLRERLGRWGLPDHLRELDRRLGTAPEAPVPGLPSGFRMPVEPERSAAGRAYLLAWKDCLPQATLRNYDAAVLALQKSSATFEDGSARAESKADLEDLRQASSLYSELLNSLSKLPRSTMISLESRDDAGRPERVSGALCRIDRDRIELFPPGAKDTRFLELEDATLASLIGLGRPRMSRPPAARTLALLCLLDGDLLSAQSILGDKAEALPAKLWVYAPEARARIPALGVPEASQRSIVRYLFYEAEREYRSARSRGAAAEKYAKLAREYAQMPVVSRALARINFRSEPCPEYVFVGSDWRSGGAFELRASPAAGTYWTSASDFVFSHANENFVEIEFYAFPGLSYRSWVRLGGCCAETFAGFYQVSDLVAPHPQKNGTQAYLEPGSIYAMTLDLSSLSLKPSHSAHAHKKEPKGPAIWAWLEIPLPRWKTPGIKRVRLMTAQEGFSIASAVVSSQRTQAPAAVEAKELEEGRAAEIYRPPPPPSTKPGNPAGEKK